MPAELAGVSRATAYRYFPNNDAVAPHATMSLADDPLADAGWAPPAAAPPDELGARAADLVRATAVWAFDHETELRTMLRLSLTPERENEQPRRGAPRDDDHAGRRHYGTGWAPWGGGCKDTGRTIPRRECEAGRNCPP